jgi:type IV pilus assembly protein PilO
MPDYSVSVDKIIKMPDSQKIMILGAVIAAIIGAYIYLIHMPNMKIEQAKQAELTTLQAKYEEQQKVLSDLPKFKKELADMELQLAESLKLLPNTREIPNLLTNISTLARECGLEILLFQPQAELAKDFYADIPVEMKVIGKYHNMGYFCDRVSKLNRIVNISDILMKATRGKGKGNIQPGTLEASFEAITFKFIEKAKGSADKKDNQKSRRRRKRK